ncbi:zinc finger protein BALDIBIS-like [Prunus dulcis]|uniref:zinc finger protein BALDIBIS-like n=1 Tax=Prunus dulcis TaxID=3755 RepID=UPI00148208E2|nr:zinc finger protein BALDIBIS-like [Prunus dulcis]
MMSEDGLSIPSTIKGLAQELSSSPNPNPNTDNQLKRKRNLPGTPDPDAEVIALSPKSLMATNRFVCEICNKGFQRDQNLQLHRRGHNLPWKLKQRSNKEVIRKKVYVCPERTCVHHEPSRALGDLTGIKKHFSRKHGEKKWKCEKCSKKYAVQSDWKAHSKVCGTREYRCDCGTLFSRKDSFITHRAFCDALAAEESARFGSASTTNMNPSFINGGNNITNINPHHQPPRIPHFIPMFQQEFAGSDPAAANNSHLNSNAFMAELLPTASMDMFGSSSSSQTQWLINNTKFPEEASFNLSMSSSSLARGLKEELEESKGSLSETITASATSFYNNNNHQHQPMSATALLQKAAQMGSTRSSSNNNNNNNPATTFNDTAFGFMSTSSNSSNNMSNQLSSYGHHHNKNEVERFNDLVNSMSSSTPATTIRDGSLFSSSFLSNKHLMNMPGAANLIKQSQSEQSSLTRDFLGVGGDAISGVPFFQQELAKLASMGDLSQYTSSGHQ